MRILYYILGKQKYSLFWKIIALYVLSFNQKVSQTDY